MKHDVVISYSSKNKIVADGICHYLEENRIKCWIAPRDIPPGSNYGNVISDAIMNCRVVVLVYSQNSSVSRWVSGETNAAFSNGKPIVPFRIDDTQPVGAYFVMLNQTHWIDAYPHYSDHLPDLLQSLERLLNIKTNESNPLNRNTNLMTKNESSNSDYQNMIPSTIVGRSLSIWWIGYILVFIALFSLGVILPYAASCNITSDAGQIFWWVIMGVGILCCIVFSYFYIKDKPGKQSDLVSKADYVQKKHGLSIFVKNKRYGVMNMGGYKIVIPAEYDSLKWVTGNTKLLHASKSGKQFRIDIYNNKLD